MILKPIFKNTERGFEVQNFINHKSENVELKSILNYDYRTHNNQHIIPNFELCKPSIICELLKIEELHQKIIDGKDENYFQIFQNMIVISRATDTKKNNEIYLISYENKFNQDFTDFNKALDLITSEYNEGKVSISADAKQAFLDTIEVPRFGVRGGRKPYTKKENESLFMKMFPQLDSIQNDFLEQCKKNMSQFYYLKAVKEYHNIFSYDIKKSFPSTMLNKRHPHNSGVLKNEIDNKMWYCANIIVRTCKAKKLDFFGICKKISLNNYAPTSFFFTREMIETIPLLYDIDFEIVSALHFPFRKSVFDTFFLRNAVGRVNAPKHINQYLKYQSNTLIGSFGKNQREQTTVYFLENQNDKEYLRANEIPLKQNVYNYLPIYLFVNGVAVSEFCKIIYKNFDSVVYANTDGFYSLEDIDFDFYNSNFSDPLGKFELRDTIKNAMFKDYSNYSYETTDGELVVKISGCTIDKDDITYEKYKSGNFKKYVIMLSPFGFCQMYFKDEDMLKKYEEKIADHIDECYKANTKFRTLKKIYQRYDFLYRSELTDIEFANALEKKYITRYDHLDRKFKKI